MMCILEGLGFGMGQADRIAAWREDAFGILAAVLEGRVKLWTAIGGGAAATAEGAQR